MPTIIQNKFDGGHAEDIRTTQTNQCEASFNFDLYSQPYRLLPIRDSVAETTGSGTMDDIEISDVDTSVIASNIYITAVGFESNVSVKPAFYTRSSGMNGSWSQQAVGTGTFQKGTGITYQEKMHCISLNSSTQYSLQRYNGASDVTSLGTIAVAAAVGTGYPTPRPFIHPSDKKLYFAVANIIAQWDGTTLRSFSASTIALKIPVDYDITSLTDYGDYLAIATKPHNGEGNSVMYLWDRDVSLVDANTSTDAGEGALNVLENINNNLIGLVYNKDFGTYSSKIGNRLDIKLFTGGTTQIVKSIDLGSQSNINILKVRNGDKLYFSIGGSAVSIWCVYKNKDGIWTVNQERYLYNGSTVVADTIQTIQGMSVVGDFFYLGFYDNVGGYSLRATSSSALFANTSIYKTTINPSMPLVDRYKLKQLVAVQIAYVGAGTGTTVLKYSVDGSTFTTIISDTNSAGQKVTEATNENTGTVFLSGRELQFQIESTGGSQIKEIRYRYESLNTTI